jgi:Phosphotransferase enzyme family
LHVKRLRDGDVDEIDEDVVSERGSSEDRSVRQDRAIRSAVAVAERFGIVLDGPAVVADSNNTIVGLNDRVVAKVATTRLPGRATALDRELEVLAFLAGRDAPVAALSDLAPRIVHEAHGTRMLLLERLDIVDADPDAHSVIGAIDALHACLAPFDGMLPSFLDSFAAARAVLAEPIRSPALPAPDRQFMSDVADQISASFDETTWPEMVLHGDPWIGGNLVATPVGLRLVDFEAACVGPREWDLSSIGRLADAAPGVSMALLEQCRALRSYTVAAWCWSQPSRAPEVDQAARWHLHLLHDRFDIASS